MVPLSRSKSPCIKLRLFVREARSWFTTPRTRPHVVDDTLAPREKSRSVCSMIGGRSPDALELGAEGLACLLLLLVHLCRRLWECLAITRWGTARMHWQGYLVSYSRRCTIEPERATSRGSRRSVRRACIWCAARPRGSNVTTATKPQGNDLRG